MSYDITFLKQRLNFDETLFEDRELDDSFLIDNRKQLQIDLQALGSFVSLTEHIASSEITYTNFQLTIFQDQIGLTIPYWKENLEKDIQDSILGVINFLIKKGFYGYDSQTEEVIDTISYDFYNRFKMMLRTLFPQQLKSNNRKEQFLGEESAAIYFFRKRDYILKKVEILQSHYSDKVLDFSPDSLVSLEFISWDYIKKDKFHQSTISKPEFNLLLSYYKAVVYVKHKKFTWKIHLFGTYGYYLAVQTRDGGHTIMLGSRDSFERFPDKKFKALLKEYKRNA